MISLDIIGHLHTPSITNEHGEYVSGGDTLPGWYVNTIPAVPEWEQYRITPSQKRRVFAGLESETCCYVFEDEDSFAVSAIAAGLAQEPADV